jgi:hypothetical protein
MPQQHGPIAWAKIDHPHTNGFRAEAGRRAAEVVEAYPGEWWVFRWVDGYPVKQSDPVSIGKRAAIKWAESHLRSDRAELVWVAPGACDWKS